METLLKLTIADMLEEGKRVFKSIVTETVKEVLTSEGLNGGSKSEMLSAKDLCDRWHICRSTLENYVAQNKISPVRIGRRVLYCLDEVLKAEMEGNIKR